MKKEELLITRLKTYAQSDMLPLHMPGHKRQAMKEPAGIFPNPFSVDITEIKGFDNLHYPEGILKRSMEWAAGVYGAERTYYLVNGSSGGILSAISAAVNPGGRILMSRNCHKSAYHGAILRGIHTEYIYPQILPDLGIQGGILTGDVERMLERHPDTEAVLITSPTYDGIVSDICEIAKVAHHHGIPLIVDEAHGAHFSFGGQVFPKSAISCGADVVIQSLHKTLPSLTQTAVLHLCSERVDAALLEQYLQMYQSSSPSYVFMAAIEQCIYEMETDGLRHMREFAGRLERLRGTLKGLTALYVPGSEVIGRSGVFDMDLSKIVVSCRGCTTRGTEGCINLTGEMLGSWLREEYGIEPELCGTDYLVGITTWLDREQAFYRVEKALMEIDGRLEKADTIWGDRIEKISDSMQWEEYAKVCLTLAEAMEAGFKELPFEQCAGQISKEFIYLYPPGIPIIAPGEMVSKVMVEKILRYREMGLSVQGMADKNGDKLKVVDDSRWNQRLL